MICEGSRQILKKKRTIEPPVSVVSHVTQVDVALLVQLFDQVSEIAFFVKDAKGCYVAVNQSLLTRHGLKNSSQVIGKRPIDVCPGDFGRIPTEQDASVLSSGRPIIDHLEMQWHLPNEPVWCQTTKLPIRDSSGNVFGIVGFSRDVRAPLDRTELPSDLAEALVEFETHLFSDVTPAWLAHRSNLSSQRLTRLMKRIFDLTPSQFITRARIASASRILIETDRSVADIAHSAGFYDHSAFARAFRFATGVSPTEFRAACRA